MPDPVFEDPRLVEVYDGLEPDRRDLDAYLGIVKELGAHSVLDIGCGTGVFARLLAARGYDVVAVDPARGSLDYARRQPGANDVRWLFGDATDLPPLRVDLATMTGNVAQAIVDPYDWEQTLRGVHAALRPGGRLVFETRDAERRDWERWEFGGVPVATDVPGVGLVEAWGELLEVDLPLLSFRQWRRFASDGAVLSSDSTLRFRTVDEASSDLVEAGFLVEEIRDAPDRPGLEFVFVARAVPSRP